MEKIFDKYLSSIKNTETVHYVGSVVSVKGNLVESLGPRAVIGEICKIKIENPEYHGRDPKKRYINRLAEVTGLHENIVQLTCYNDTNGIEIGCEVIGSETILKVGVGPNLLGRVVDALGNPYDGLGEIIPETFYPAIAASPNPILRKPVDSRVLTGIRAIDSLMAVGKGQRLGIMAGSGVGKSTLMGMIARNTNADINVIALVGERGREVNDFIRKDLGEEGLKRSVIVVATSDMSSICRLRAAYTATAIAEYFRDQGKDVMFMMDNMKRFADAQREIALVAGEPAAQRGYTPSVFDLIPKLLERTGTNDKGSITAFYNVLIDGDDMNEPITDKVRGTVDGHIVLNRNLAAMNHYPAIDVLASISRLANDITGPKTREACSILRKLMASYEASKDLIDVGAYQAGSNPLTDKAIALHDRIEEFLIQERNYNASLEETLDLLSKLTGVEIPKEEY